MKTGNTRKQNDHRPTFVNRTNWKWRLMTCLSVQTWWPQQDLTLTLTHENIIYICMHTSFSMIWNQSKRPRRAQHKQAATSAHCKTVAQISLFAEKTISFSSFLVFWGFHSARKQIWKLASWRLPFLKDKKASVSCICFTVLYFVGWFGAQTGIPPRNAGPQLSSIARVMCKLKQVKSPC